MNYEKAWKVITQSINTEEGKKNFYNNLCKIKGLKEHKGKDKIDIEVIDNVLVRLLANNQVKLQGINIQYSEEDNTVYYSCSLMESKSYEWIGILYGRTLEEILCRIVMAMYMYERFPDLEWRRR